MGPIAKEAKELGRLPSQRKVSRSGGDAGDLSATLPETFEGMYRTEFPVVFAAALLLARDPDLAEEATQQAFAKALERWSRLSTHPRPGGWVTVTALNLVRRALRLRRLRGQRLTTLAAPNDPGIGEQEDRIDLWQSIASLPERQRQAILLFYIGGLPVRDVAVQMRCSPGTVKAHLAKARQHIGSRIVLEEP
jgi:RNA polymerase sigma-70 factor (ECF subfamily)